MHHSRMRHSLLTATAFMLAVFFTLAAQAQQQQSELFAKVKPGLFVVEVTERESGNKILIGSGFLLDTAATAGADDEPVMVISADEVGDISMGELIEQLEVIADDQSAAASAQP